MSFSTASGAIEYYAEKTLDYYRENPDDEVLAAPWSSGGLARSLGVEHGPNLRQLRNLIEGRDPSTGTRLAQTGHRKETLKDGTTRTVETRTGLFDVPLTAPKGLSDIYARSDRQTRQKIETAMLRAARVKFETLAEHARVARLSVKTPTQVGARTTKMQGSATERMTASLMAFPVLGRASRSTPETIARDAPPDPHLAVHIVIPTLCEREGRYYTADSYDVLKQHDFFNDAAYAELAVALEEIGIELEYTDIETARRGRSKFEPVASTYELREHWSSNSRERICQREQFRAENNGREPSEAEARAYAYDNRQPKSELDKAQDHDPDVSLWRSDALAAGLKVREFTPNAPIERDPYRSLQELNRHLNGPAGLCIEQSYFSGAAILPSVVRCGLGLGFSNAELKGYANSLIQSAIEQPGSNGLVPIQILNDPRRATFTTRTVVAAELRIAQAASEKDRVVTEPIDELTIARTLREAAVKLDREQIDAVREMCAGKGWVNFIGPAGSGKSTVLRAVVGAHRAHDKYLVDKADYQKRVAVAAHRQGRPARNDGRPTTVEIVVASMTGKAANDTGQKIGADRWGSVESICRQVESGKFKPTKNTLVFIEECGQMDTLRMDKLRKAIGPARVIPLGDPAQLTPIGAGGWWDDNLSKHGSVELTVVRRHKDPKDVADFDLIRKGRAPQALRNMEQRGRVHISEDRSHRVADVLMDYTKHRVGWRAQDVKIIADTSNEDIDTINRFIGRYRLEHGEVGAAGFEVHDESRGRRWTLRENDQVLFLRAHFTKGQTPVKNGTEGVIVSLDARTGTARVRIPDRDGQRIVRMRLNGHEPSPPLGLAYAVHANKYQGAEVPIALVMPGMGQTNANSAYSMVTRSTHETHIYEDHETHGPNPTEAIGKAWSKHEIKQSALSKLNEIRREEWQRKQERTQEREREQVELHEVPELEPIEFEEVPEIEQVRLDQIRQELSRADAAPALRDPAQERQFDFDPPSFEPDPFEPDLGLDLERGIER